MTPSNLDLARECGASGAWTSDFYKHSIVFSMNQLDAFAARIRADALAAAPSQPVALPVERKPLTDERIVRLWRTHVGTPSPAYPLTEIDVISFARAIGAEYGITAQQGEKT